MNSVQIATEAVSRPTSGAAFSDCRRYRYHLWRKLEPEQAVLSGCAVRAEMQRGAGACLFIMLNPSTADEVENDPTIERCERRARGMGYSELLVCNIFALRSTNPIALYADEIDPVGPNNDHQIAASAECASLVICAWGAHGKHLGRGAAVLKLLRKLGVRPHVFKINADGTPAHPLYLPYALTPVPL